MAGRLDVPTGDYYDGIKGGAGFGGTLHVRLSHDLALQGSVTELGLGFEDKFGIISYDPQLQIVSQNYDMDALRLLAGVEYHKAIRTSAARWGFWYLHASVGAIRHKLTGEAVLFDAGTSQTYRFVLDDTDTRFTMENGIGLIYGLSDRIGIAAQADVDGVWTDDYSSGGGSSVAIRGIVLGGNIGLAVRL